MLLLAAFAGLALLLATVGIYSVMSYSVSRRTHEIGIRISLGAKSADVLLLVVRQGLILAAAGSAIGIIGALILSRLLATLLYGVRPTDALTFISVACLLMIVALAACWSQPGARCASTPWLRFATNKISGRMGNNNKRPGVEETPGLFLLPEFALQKCV